MKRFFECNDRCSIILGVTRPTAELWLTERNHRTRRANSRSLTARSIE
jgi:hypothetical protein